MADEITVTLTPTIQQLEALYRSYPQIVRPFAAKALKQATLAIVGYMKTEGYPPTSEANRPGRTRIIPGALYKDGKDRIKPLGYYERGRGAWYPIMKREHLPQKLGKTRGAILARRRNESKVVGYKLAGGGLSQRLGASWVTRLEDGPGESMIGWVGTNTTYADWVQGPNQAKIHQQRGWITLSQAIELARSDINEAFQEALTESLKVVARKGSVNAATNSPA